MKIYPPQGYRKWWLAAAALIMSEGNVLLDRLTGEQWILALVAILGVVGFSAVGGKVADAIKKNGMDS